MSNTKTEMSEREITELRQHAISVATVLLQTRPNMSPEEVAEAVKQITKATFHDVMK